MKEANMEALAMTPTEEALNDSKSGGNRFKWYFCPFFYNYELILKAGNGTTSRRMKGSPRQLETAVPTSKNPHGVWV